MSSPYCTPPLALSCPQSRYPHRCHVIATSCHLTTPSLPPISHLRAISALSAPTWPSRARIQSNPFDVRAHASMPRHCLISRHVTTTSLPPQHNPPSHRPRGTPKPWIQTFVDLVHCVSNHLHVDSLDSALSRRPGPPWTSTTPWT